MNEIDKGLLLNLAKESIESEEEPNYDVVKHLNQKKGVFIVLKKNNELKGGMGVLECEEPLYKAIVDAARKAAFEDPRFKPLKRDDVRFIKIEISVLDTPEPLLNQNPDDYPSSIEIGTNGLIMEGNNRALLLPYVAREKSYTASQFLNALAQSAGLSFNAWKDVNNKILKFKAETFSE